MEPNMGEMKFFINNITKTRPLWGKSKFPNEVNGFRHRRASSLPYEYQNYVNLAVKARGWLAQSNSEFLRLVISIYMKSLFVNIM